LVLSRRRPRGGAPDAEPVALIYGIPAWFRAMLVLVVAIVAAALAFGNRGSVIGWAVLAISALAALYEERWTFDRESGQASARIGLLVAARGPHFSLGDAERLRLDVFVKGRLDQSVVPPDDKMPWGSQLRLILHLRSGESYMLDSLPYKQGARLRRTAEELSRFLGVPLE